MLDKRKIKDYTRSIENKENRKMKKETFYCKNCWNEFKLPREAVQLGMSTDFCSVNCAHLYFNKKK